MNINFIKKYVSVKTFLVFLSLYFVMFVFVLPQMSYPEIIPDKMFNYDVNELYDILSNYTIVERSNYINSSLMFDIIYPVIYSITLFIPLFLLVNKLNLSKKFKYLCLFPFIAFFADILENVLIIYNIIRIENFDYSIGEITAILTRIKWSFIYLSIFMIVNLFIYLKIIKGNKKSDENTSL